MAVRTEIQPQTQTMTPKQRWLAALEFKPIDHLPFWPKLNPAYAPAQSPPFHDMDLMQLHRWIGSEPQVGLSVSILRETRSNTGYEEHEQDGVRHKTFHTPAADLTARMEWDEDSRSWHPVTFPIKTRQDIAIMTQWYDDLQVDVDRDKLSEAQANYERIGQDAVVQASIGESGLMHWVEWLAGIENAHFLLADFPDEVWGLFESIQRVLLRHAEILIEHSPADLLYLVENTSTTLISVEQYQRYDYAHIKQLGELVTGAGRRLMLHMCGHLKALLGDLSTLPVTGFEAFTAPTLGNTTLLDGRTTCPGKALVGGTNAMLWLKSPDEICTQIGQWLDQLPHHRGLVTSSAGVMPPLCPPQTIKAVCDFIHSYPLRV